MTAADRPLAPWARVGIWVGLAVLCLAVEYAAVRGTLALFDWWVSG